MVSTEDRFTSDTDAESASLWRDTDRVQIAESENEEESSIWR